MRRNGYRPIIVVQRFVVLVTIVQFCWLPQTGGEIQTAGAILPATLNQCIGAMEAMGVTQGGPCPVCRSAVTGYLRDVPTVRTGRMLPLYGCFACRSFWNPSGYVEDDRVLRLDLAWGKSVVERNTKAGNALFDTLAALGESPVRILEIGCGIGTMLSVAESRGIRAIGYDVNPIATDYARLQGVDARTEAWSADTALPKIDLVLCISVLEHIEKPRPLIEQLCLGAIKHDAALYVSVPFLEERSWRFIETAAPNEPGTPFIDNDVHVTHFSKSGLLCAMKDFGLASFKPVTTGLWHGFVARA